MQWAKYVGSGTELPCHPPGIYTSLVSCRLSKPHTLGIFMEVASCRHDQLTHFPDTPPSPEDEVGKAES